jgi:hypothetical protein
MIRFGTLCYLIIFLLQPAIFHASDQSDQSSDSIIAIIDIDGTARYTEPDWQAQQDLQVGDLISASSRLKSLKGSLVVLCPDGAPKVIYDYDIVPNSPIQCTTSNRITLTPVELQFGLETLRGGIQDESIPYLIAPRATVMRDKNFRIIWHPIDNVKHYELNILEDFGAESSGILAPEAVVHEGTAVWEVPNEIVKKLKWDVPYTIEICVTFTTLTRHCTTDEAWRAKTDLTFYFNPLAELAEAENTLVSSRKPLNLNDSELLFARAVLLSQPIYQLPNSSLHMGAYFEASQLLEAMLAQNSSAELTNSAAVNVLLGNLYLKMGLNQSAQIVFQRAKKLALNDHNRAQASLGLGIAAHDLSEIDRSLNLSAHYELPITLLTTLKSICMEFESQCIDLPQCNDAAAQCEVWGADHEG